MQPAIWVPRAISEQSRRFHSQPLFEEEFVVGIHGGTVTEDYRLGGGLRQAAFTTGRVELHLSHEAPDENTHSS
jgi:hypothetical protein